MAIAKIMTYNLRGVWMWNKEGKQCFVFRAGLIYDKIMREKPDIIAFQEVVPKLLELMKRMLPEYEFYGQGRDADYGGEGLYTAIRKDAWNLIAYETFWISPTPYVPASRFAIQSDCPRICVVTHVRHKETGKMLRLYNVHLDHISDAARIEGIQCVLDKMDAINKQQYIPSMLMGDFNARPDSETIRFCTEHKDPVIKEVTENIPVTFHNYGTDAQKIDFIYVSEDLADAVVANGIWDTVFCEIYLSDHYPVWADFDLEKL